MAVCIVFWCTSCTVPMVKFSNNLWQLHKTSVKFATKQVWVQAHFTHYYCTSNEDWSVSLLLTIPVLLQYNESNVKLPQMLRVCWCYKVSSSCCHLRSCSPTTSSSKPEQVSSMLLRIATWQFCKHNDNNFLCCKQFYSYEVCGWVGEVGWVCIGSYWISLSKGCKSAKIYMLSNAKRFPDFKQ